MGVESVRGSERDEKKSRGESRWVGGGIGDGSGRRALALDGDGTRMGEPEWTDGGAGVSPHRRPGASLAARAVVGRGGDGRTRRRDRAALPSSPTRADWSEVGAHRRARVRSGAGRAPGRSARHWGAPHGWLAQGAPRARSGPLRGLPSSGGRALPVGDRTGDRGDPDLRGSTLARGGASSRGDALPKTDSLAGRPPCSPHHRSRSHRSDC